MKGGIYNAGPTHVHAARPLQAALVRRERQCCPTTPPSAWAIIMCKTSAGERRLVSWHTERSGGRQTKNKALNQPQQRRTIANTTPRGERPVSDMHTTSPTNDSIVESWYAHPCGTSLTSALRRARATERVVAEGPLERACLTYLAKWIMLLDTRIGEIAQDLQRANIVISWEPSIKWRCWINFLDACIELASPRGAATYTF
jgi:hypothetical protein